MDAFRAVLERLRAILKKVAQSVIDFWRRIRALLQPLITAERGRRAKQAWRLAQRNARMLSRHPDLVAADRYLDSWYPGVIRA